MGNSERFMATACNGIDVTFHLSTVIDWSWNCAAQNTESDAPLEVVFDRGGAESLTQRLFFYGFEAERVLYALLRHVGSMEYSCTGPKDGAT